MPEPNGRSNHEIEIDFKDLEQLLQKSFKSKQLKVIDHVATTLLPAGENYCSIMVKLEVIIRKTENTKEEKLFLVAKTKHKNDTHFLEWTTVFKKELFIYAELLPAYRDLEREIGIEESDLIDVIPTYIGYRNSLNEKNDVVDENSLLLMENMVAKGFYVGNRLIGLDVDHASKALKSLARYHALGIASKHKRPKFFNEAIKQAQNLGFDAQHLSGAYERELNVYHETPHLNKHIKIIEKCFQKFIDGSIINETPEEPWATINHGDFWVNNILFHKNEITGKVDDVKFVDFQTYFYCSALRDLPYFFCGSLDNETVDNHFDYLLNLYYQHFIQTLERLDCDVTLFSKDNFDVELKKQALIQFPLCTLAIKFFVHEVDEKDKNNENLLHVVLENTSSDAYIEKLVRLIEIYETRGWFST